MKTAIKTTLAVVASAAAIAGVATIPSIVSAWGDSDGGRPSYSLQEINEGVLGDKITFNSITIADSDYAWYKNTYGETMPTGFLTHEKNYVGAREDTGVNAGKENVWAGNDITVEDGKTYIVRMYVHNNNPNGWDAVAENTKVKFNVPNESAKTIKVNGYISSSNASPNSYVDYVNFNSDTAFHLEYVAGSALLENNGKAGGSKLDDSIVKAASTDGVLIGYDALDGRVPGCYDYSNYVTIKVKAVYDREFTITKKVRLADSEDKTWKTSVDAKVGDRVEFQIQYKNTSSESHRNVMIRDVLPTNLKYVDNTTMIINTKYPSGAKIVENSIATNGLNIGHYAAGANAYIRFTAEVVDNNLACGSNTLVNWAQGQAGSNESNRPILQDYATVVLNKVCENEPDEPTPTPEPEPTPELPYTGPEAIAGGVIAAGSIVTAAGYYIASRRQLR